MSGPLLRTSMWSRTAERRIDVAVDRIAVHGWWAHQGSNLEPKDSLSRAFPPGADYLITRSLRWWGAGRSSLSSRALQPPGSLCTFRRCTAGLAQDRRRPGRCGFPEFIPFLIQRFRAGVTFSMSPLL